MQEEQYLQIQEKKMEHNKVPTNSYNKTRSGYKARRRKKKKTDIQHLGHSEKKKHIVIM